jgi:hypothetical protein
MSQTLIWILVLITAGSLGALAYVMLERRRKTERPLPGEWSLTARPVFNQHERRVHRQLREALPQQVVLAKLPLVRFCHPTDPEQVHFWFDLLGATHVSFAVCSPSGRVLAAIDLDDGRNPARRSVKVKQAVLAACHIRYVRYLADQTPSVPELQLLVPVTPSDTPHPANAAVMASSLKSGDPNAPRPQTRSARWPDSGYLKRDSSFGRDSVITGFSASFQSVLPDTDGKVVDAPPTRH